MYVLIFSLIFRTDVSLNGNENVKKTHCYNDKEPKCLDSQRLTSVCSCYFLSLFNLFFLFFAMAEKRGKRSFDRSFVRIYSKEIRGKLLKSPKKLYEQRADWTSKRSVLEFQSFG